MKLFTVALFAIICTLALSKSQSLLLQVGSFMEAKYAQLGDIIESNQTIVAAEIFTGFIQGLGLERNVTELPACIASATNFTIYLQQAEQMYNNGSFSNIIKAIAILGQAFGALNEAQIVCPEAQTELQAYWAQFESDFSHSNADLQVLEQLLFDQTALSDVVNILNDYAADSWVDFGNALGAIIDYVHEKVVEDEILIL